jgi:chromosome segregation ATPase
LVKELKVENENLKREIERLQKELSEKLAEISKLTREVNELRQENERLKAAIEQERLANERMGAEIEQLRALLAEKMNELNALLAQLAQLRAQNAELTSLIEQLKPEIDQLRKKIAALKTEIETLIEENNKLRKANTKLASEMELLKTQYNTLVEKYTGVQKDCKDLSDENDKLRVSCDQLVEKYRMLEDQKAKSLTELQYYKETGGASDDEGLKRENQRIFENNRELKDANRKLRDTNDQLLADVDKWKNTVLGLRMQIEDLLEDKRRKNEKRRNNKEEKERNIEMVKTSIIKLRGNAPAPVEGPIAMYQKRGDTAIIEKKSRVKSLAEAEKAAKSQHRMGHYITHPCPYCSPNGGAECPVHHHAEALPELTLEQAKVLLLSDNEKDKMRALLRIMAFANENPRFKKMLIERYGSLSVYPIIRSPEWEESILQFLEECDRDQEVDSEDEEVGPPSTAETRKEARKAKA